jgi:hypothetical protein
MWAYPANLGKEYSDKDKEVKKSMRRDKRKWTDDLAKEAEKAAQTGNMKSVYDVIKKLCKLYLQYFLSCCMEFIVQRGVARPSV